MMRTSDDFPAPDCTDDEMKGSGVELKGDPVENLRTCAVAQRDIIKANQGFGALRRRLADWRTIPGPAAFIDRAMADCVTGTL